MPKSKTNRAIPRQIQFAMSSNDLVKTYSSNGLFLIVNSGEEEVISESIIYAGIILHSGAKLTVNAPLGSREFPILYCNIAEDAEILLNSELYCVESEKSSIPDSKDSSRIISCETPPSIEEWKDKFVVPVGESPSIFDKAHATLPMSLFTFAGFERAVFNEIVNTAFDRTWGSGALAEDDLEEFSELLGGVEY